MDAGVSAIVAATISTMAGGTIGFVSSYLSIARSDRRARALLSVPKQMEAAELVAMTIFRRLSGSSVHNTEWDKYISACFWLPDPVRRTCLSIVSEPDNETALRNAQKEIIVMFDSITMGETK